MPPLVIAALLAVGAWAAYRVARRVLVASEPTSAPSVASRASESPAGEVPVKDLGHLELDPATGEYRPKEPR